MKRLSLSNLSLSNLSLFRAAGLMATGAALLGAGVATPLAAQAGSAVLEAFTQAQHAAAEKARSFGLGPDLESQIPEELNQSQHPTAQDADGSGRGIIGLSDDRAPMTSRSYPWSAIGRLQSPVDENTITICSGTLVAPDIVLTNAHCVINPETSEIKPDITFHPNMIDGRVADPSHIAQAVDLIYGTDFRNDNRAPHPQDWAFVQLDRPLGDTYGTLGWTPLSVGDLVRNHRNQIITVGYSGDFPAEAPGRTAGVHMGCNVLGEVEGSLIHDCDTHPGSSGGPMMTVINGEYRIIGINSAERTERATNPTTGEVVASRGIVNYGVKIQPIIDFLRQAQR
ncbi:trypsin-like serine peptidase [Leptolyngbya sp. BL0902]|uniref:trypsin-like serine peptidase n=1 Tax=Leptolyngbya sp. BL0902 TaxID=1115757 RepID=UPI0018E8E7B8|nr:trypsin-like peptidase domain-containing protein [Leptolyngbya sp. BL0902]